MDLEQQIKNITDFTSLYISSIFPTIRLNSSMDYDSFQKLNTTIHTLVNNGELLQVLFKNKSMPKWFVAPKRDALYIIVPLTVVYVLILLAGIIGNVSTCIVIIRNKNMHTATNYYLFSLAISDLLLLLSGLPPEVYRVWHPDEYVFGETSCRLLGLFSETSTNATVLTITAFTIERYIAICHPFFSHTTSKLSRVIKFIIAIWLVALCLAVPQAIQFGVIYEWQDNRFVSSCTVKWDYLFKIMEHAFEISGFVFFVGPMTAITVLYILIGIKLHKSRLLSRGKTSQNSFQENNNSVRSFKNGKSQSRAIKMLVAVAVSFFICWAPFHAQRLLAVYGTNAEEPSPLFFKIYNSLIYLSGILYFLSTSINPFLYNIMSNKFREAFKSTITNQCCERSNRHMISNGIEVSSKKTISLNSSEKKFEMIDKTNKNIIETNDNDPTISLLNTITDKLCKTTRYMFDVRVDSTNENDRRHSFISNSSLQNMDNDEYTGKELATFMEQ